MQSQDDGNTGMDSLGAAMELSLRYNTVTHPIIVGNKPSMEFLLLHFRRRPLSWPILLAIFMIVSLVALIVGWFLLPLLTAGDVSQLSPAFWLFLSIGAALLVLLVAGVVIYLILTIKAINLNRRQSNFVDSVTHELKSPIASLKLYLQTLRRHTLEPDQQAKFYVDMLEDVERLDTLINHMLSVARIERSEESPREPVQLADLLRRCASTVCNRYRVDPETIQLDLEPAIVLANPIDLELIFHNLMDNAVKYAGRPPEVLVTSRVEPAESVMVRVADNGKGIPRHQRARAFRRFVRLVPELERDKPGTGLGLYIVRTLVERLRGSVRILNRESRPGTELSVRLRLYQPPEKISS